MRKTPLKHSAQVFHKTSNLGEAAYLMTKSFQFKGVLSNDHRTKEFVFSGQTIHSAALDFHNNASVPAKTFVENYRSLKEYLYNRDQLVTEIKEQKAPMPKALRKEIKNVEGNR